MHPDVNLNILRERLEEAEIHRFSPHAALSRDAVRRRIDAVEGVIYRQAFAMDADRILHSLAYTRYIDKTQVFYLIRNDHLTHRVLHVQLVSKIARTIGRFLRLNEDLIESISLGHDIGHTPFGHEGEHYLSAICASLGIGYFRHNVQGVHFLERVERKGKGWNLTIQTLDGILCHDGEVHDGRLSPSPAKSFDELDRCMACKIADPALSLIPMTLEGCVVRISDTIAYIGRDIEDAIRIGLINRSDLPKRCVETLGRTNGHIVYALVTDVIQNSLDQAYIAFSPRISEALRELKSFNYERIYLNPKIKSQSHKIKILFEWIVDRFLNDLKNDRQNSPIFSQFLAEMSADYIGRARPEEIVRDFVSGMTDTYFLQQCPSELHPKILRFDGCRDREPEPLH